MTCNGWWLVPVESGHYLTGRGPDTGTGHTAAPSPGHPTLATPPHLLPFHLTGESPPDTMKHHNLAENKDKSRATAVADMATHNSSLSRPGSQLREYAALQLHAHSLEPWIILLSINKINIFI